MTPRDLHRRRILPRPLQKLTRREIEDAIDLLIDHLNAMDGDPDLEPDAGGECGAEEEESATPATLCRLELYHPTACAPRLVARRPQRSAA